MSTNYLILWLALGGAVAAVAGFVWSVRSGQLDDLETPPHRLLLDEIPEPLPPVSQAAPPASQPPTPP